MEDQQFVFQFKFKGCEQRFDTPTLTFAVGQETAAQIADTMKKYAEDGYFKGELRLNADNGTFNIPAHNVLWWRSNYNAEALPVAEESATALTPGDLNSVWYFNDASGKAELKASVVQKTFALLQRAQAGSAFLDECIHLMLNPFAKEDNYQEDSPQRETIPCYTTDSSWPLPGIEFIAERTQLRNPEFIGPEPWNRSKIETADGKKFYGTAATARLADCLVCLRYFAAQQTTDNGAVLDTETD